MSNTPPLSEPHTGIDRPSNVRWLIFVLACGTSWFLYLHRYTWNFVKPRLQEEYGWNDSQAQAVYSLFNLTYGLGQIPSGVLCDYLGPHVFLVASMGLWSIALPLHALASTVTSLAAVRLLFGVAQAGCFPILAKVSRTWFPLSYRTGVQACIASFSGRIGGAMASIIMASLLMGYCHLTWRSSLWIMGGAGLVFAVLFAILFRDSPDRDPRVNSAELRHIQEGSTDGAKSSERQFMSWSHALTNLSLWFLLIQQLLVAGVDTVFLTYMGQFFERRSDIPGMAGWLAALPLIGGAIGGTFAGFLNDALLRANRGLIIKITALMGCVLGGFTSVLVGGGLTSTADWNWSSHLLELLANLLQHSALGCLGGAFGGAIVGVLLLPVAGSRRWCRSVIGAIGALMASLMFFIVMRQTNVMAAAAVLFTVKFFSDMQQPTQWGVCTDIGGRFSATVFAIVNTAGNVGGILIPNLFGLLNDANSSKVMVDGVEKTLINFTPLFMSAGVMYTIAAICWLFTNTTSSVDVTTFEKSERR
ncbi:MAG: sauU 2 [Planctomycetaceae bacterium]|nr:sauU 2 [Planctomycetaceae bacterium]